MPRESGQPVFANVAIGHRLAPHDIRWILDRPLSRTMTACKMGTSTTKRTAFVTGASYGVGAATALALARDGFDVAVSATRPENVADTVAKLEQVGARAVPVVLDLKS